MNVDDEDALALELEQADAMARAEASEVVKYIQSMINLNTVLRMVHGSGRQHWAWAL